MPKLQANQVDQPVLLISKRTWLVIAVLLLAGWVLAWVCARCLVVTTPIQRAEAIVVLSGSSRIVERNQLAAQLFLQGRAPKIILTNDNQKIGWNNQEERNLFSYEWAKKILQQQGVPSDRIEVLMEPVTGTYEEVQLVRQSMEQHQGHSILFVTSAYHSRRTLWTVRHLFQGTNIECGLMAPSPTLSPWSWWLHQSGWKMVVGEYVKMAYYWLRFSLAT